LLLKRNLVLSDIMWDVYGEVGEKDMIYRDHVDKWEIISSL